MPVSKSRRNPKKPAPAKRGNGAAESMPAHGQLRDDAGLVVGGVALRGDEWIVVVNGRVAATTESAGLAIAMLRHTATLLGNVGSVVTVDTSGLLRERATQEGDEAGKSLEEYLDFLEAERAELAGERGGDGDATGFTTH